VSLGGALACNVHGKNHYRSGDFAEHVLSVRLVLPSGEAVECSPTRHADLFWATAGGMGMTGLIESLTLKLKPIRSASLSATTYRVESLEDMVAAFENYKDAADYMVGWIDHMAKGDDIGRGIFEAASHMKLEDGGAPLEKFTLPEPKINIPAFVPSFVLNRYVMAIYNRLRFKKYSAWRQAEIIDFNTFFHPLDRLGHWYRLYGRQGFFQYQALFPETHDVVQQMRTFLTAIQKKKLFSYLAVIKYHRAGQGPMTFPVQGYSIALDFPNTRRVRAVLPQLDRWVSDHGGRVYLAKDAMLTPELFYTMYGKPAEAWTQLIRANDPQKKFTSLMSERLEWK
jgi:FAD/FMN-containing dehydrogenase